MQAQRPRHTLSLSEWQGRGSCLKLAAELSKDSPETDDTQRFEVRLWAARNSWDIGRRAGGLFGARIAKDQADAALRRAFAAIADGGEA